MGISYRKMSCKKRTDSCEIVPTIAFSGYRKLFSTACFCESAGLHAGISASSTLQQMAFSFIIVSSSFREQISKISKKSDLYETSEPDPNASGPETVSLSLPDLSYSAPRINSFRLRRLCRLRPAYAECERPPSAYREAGDSVPTKPQQG